jgi:CoA-dependent NAD(P)H sulfur oxidoreductase
MRLVVIGGNAAGLSAASRARRIDRDLDIQVLEKSPDISYGSCGLPYYLDSRVHSLDELKVYSAEYLEREREIQVRTRTAVTAIAYPRRQIVLASGEEIPFDRLVIATGARSNKPPIPGSEHPRVFTLQTLDDAERLKRFLDENSPRHAAVIGAGYIGLEMVEVLRANGLRVTLFASDGALLGRNDATLVNALTDRFRRFGVNYRPNEPVRAIEPDQVNGFPADIVVIAAGFLPNAELAENAGVEIGQTGAIRVNEHLETNLHDVYAAGDCTEITHRISGRPAYIPLGTTANKMGRIAGANAAGRRERFHGVMGTSIVRVCGLGAGITGLTPWEAKQEGFQVISASIEALERAKYFWGTQLKVELVAQQSSGKLLGGTVIGERGVAGRINVIATALQARMTVDDLEQLDLAYAPPYARATDPLLIAARQLRKQLD